MNSYNIFGNTFSTFLGALLAFFSSMLLIKINSYIRYKINIRTMLLNVEDNNTQIYKIKNILCAADKDGSQKYKELFEDYNLYIQFCPVKDLWMETKSELYYNKSINNIIHTKYGEITTLYNLLCDTINYQTLFIKLRKKPPIKDDPSKSKIILDEDICELSTLLAQYEAKYEQLNLNENKNKFINMFSYIFRHNK